MQNYDCICAGSEDRPQQLNQFQNAAVGCDSPSPYRSSYAASTGKAKNSWNSVPCSNESAGGALLAMRKPLRRRSRISLEMPSAPILRNVKLRQTMRMLRARVVRVSPIDGWNLCGLQFVRPLI